MRNIKLVVEYDGTDFHGWQKQEGLRTIELELKKALDEATGEDIDIIAAGRTDKNVHATGQVINFITRADNIPGENYEKLLDFLLPDDISINSSEEVNLEFHSRFDAKKRRYKYLVYNRKLPNALFRRYSYHYPHNLDLKKMIEASKVLIGTHDFTSFKASGDDDKINTIRTIEKIDIERKDEFIEFIIEGNAFLHNMVRIIVGTLLYVGSGKLEVSNIKKILESKNREKAGITAGAEGLYLEKVFYE